MSIAVIYFHGISRKSREGREIGKVEFRQALVVVIPHVTAFQGQRYL